MQRGIKLVKYIKWISIIASFFLMGCASQGSAIAPPSAIPLQPSLQQELQITRLTQLLQREDIKPGVRAQIFAERGRFLDSVGLADLARLDYERSLQLDPAQSEVFNMLGVYFTQVSNFDSAFDAFESSLELDPNNRYAAVNRAVALYYAERYDLALQDIQDIYATQPFDPYLALWQYYIQRENGDAEQATSDLEQNYENRDDQWGWSLVGITLGKESENDVMKSVASNSKNNVNLAQNLTELYFYMAKKYQYQGQYSNAIALYKLSIGQNVYEFSEHRYAFLEMQKIFKILQEQNEEQAAVDSSDLSQ